MVTWLVLGAVLFGLAVLVLAGLVVLSRLGRLSRAAARVQRQVAGADTLRDSLAHLQERMVELQEHAGGLQARVGPRGEHE
jgi:hypothetical protein